MINKKVLSIIRRNISDWTLQNDDPPHTESEISDLAAWIYEDIERYIVNDGKEAKSSQDSHVNQQPNREG